MNNNFSKLAGSKVAAQRMKIIRFYEKYGEKATIEAFGTDRKVDQPVEEKAERHGR